jgi:hypothetical protein
MFLSSPSGAGGQLDSIRLPVPGLVRDGRPVGLAGAEHGEGDVTAASGQADEGGVVRRLPSARFRS